MALPLLAAFAWPVAAPAAAAGPGGPRARTYENPLEPRIPGDGIVGSCADPTVFRSHEQGDPNWYMF